MIVSFTKFVTISNFGRAKQKKCFCRANQYKYQINGFVFKIHIRCCLTILRNKTVKTNLRGNKTSGGDFGQCLPGIHFDNFF